MSNDVRTIVSATKNSYMNSSTGYKTLTTAEAIELKLFSGTAAIPLATTVNSQFSGGTITLIGDPSTGSTFDLAYTNVPSNACQRVVDNNGDAFVSIKIDTNTVLPATTKSEIASWCNANKTVTVTYTAS